MILVAPRRMEQRPDFQGRTAWRLRPSARPREVQGHCAPERHATPAGESHSKPAAVGRDSHTETTVEAQPPAAAATVLAQSKEDLSSRWRWRWNSASTISGALDRTAGHCSL